MSIVVTVVNKNEVINDGVGRNLTPEELEQIFVIDFANKKVQTVAECQFNELLSSTKNENIVFIKRREKRDY